MLNKLLGGIGWTTGSSIVRNLVGLLQITILTRILAKSDFGILAIASLFVSFTSLFLDLGISIGILHFKEITKKAYSSLFWLNIGMGLLLTLILYVISPLLTSSYNSEDLTAVVQILCFTIFVNSVGSQQRTVCQKEFRFKRIALIEMLSACITLSVATISAKMGAGVYSLAYSSLAGNVFNNVSHLLLGLYYNHKILFHFQLGETLPFLKIGIYSIGSNVLDFFSRELDIIIISATLGMEFLGVYNIAKKIPVSVFGLLSPVISRCITPVFAAINDNITELKAKYLLVIKVISFFAFPMYFLITALAPSEMMLFFGDEFVGGARVLSVFGVIFAFNSIGTICGSLQTALGRTDIGFIWTVYRIVSTAIVYYMSSKYGINMLLLGMIGLLFVNQYVCWRIQIKPMTGITFGEYIKSFILEFWASGGLALIIMVFLYKPNLLLSLICSIFFISLYFLIMFCTKEKLLIAEFCSKIRINKVL